MSRLQCVWRLLATAGVVVLLFLLSFHENVEETTEFSKQSQYKADDTSVLQTETFKFKVTKINTNLSTENTVNEPVRTATTAVGI